jgi:hypothetical protein
MLMAAVIATLHNKDADRAVKIIQRSDGTFGFKEFRRDAEDAGGWTLTSDSSHAMLATGERAEAAARARIPWLRDQAPAVPFRAAPKQDKPCVVASLHNTEASRCVDIVRRRDGTFGFKEFRRDPEDGGGWTLVWDNPRGVYATEAEAETAAKAGVAWLRDVVSSAKE